jgi:hypothetical protein
VSTIAEGGAGDGAAFFVFIAACRRIYATYRHAITRRAGGRWNQDSEAE